MAIEERYDCLYIGARNVLKRDFFTKGKLNTKGFKYKGNLNTKGKLNIKRSIIEINNNSLQLLLGNSDQ